MKRSNLIKKPMGIILIGVLMVLLVDCSFIKTDTSVFSHKADYEGAYLKPSSSQKQIDNDIKAYYDMWKETYVRQDTYVDSEEQYYVWYSGETFEKGSETSTPVTVSEAHGYGMLIFATMAGYDKDAKKYFDGMYQYYDAHRSSTNPNLMSWQQCDNGEALIDGADDGAMEGGICDSAIDGDMDIAYALLLADTAWGSDGEINYLEAAKAVIQGIMDSEVDQDDWTLQLGDWASKAEKTDAYYSATRPSDFMLQHLRQFELATGDERWGKVIAKTYDITESFLNGASKSTGLLPDFVIKNEAGDYVAAGEDFLEGETDGMYSYNSCRTPWRIGTDYLVTGEPKAKAILDNMNQWVKESTSFDPRQIVAGYQLDGTKAADYEDGCFTAPFLVAAVCTNDDSKEAQQWVDTLWIQCAKPEANCYYNDSITLFCLIVAGGNWSVPSANVE